MSLELNSPLSYTDFLCYLCNPFATPASGFTTLIMENIALHIEYLLHRHDCVIVPGLGAFVAVSTPAYIDDMSGMILPPLRSVRFNAAISNDDGLLVNSVARRGCLKYQEARRTVTILVDSLRARMQREGSVAIGRIGALSLEDEDRIVFTPRATDSDMAAETGLLAVSMTKRAFLTEDASPEEDTILPTEAGRRVFSDKNYYIAINKRFAHAAASVIAVLAVALSFIIAPSGRQRPVEASVLPIEKILRLHHEHPSPLPEVKPEAVKAIMTTETTEATPETQAAPAAPATQATPAAHQDGPSYHLVIATFHSAEDAAEYVESSESDIRSTLRVIKSGRTYRVSLAGSTDREKVRAMLNDGAISSRFEGAWIWEEKK